MIFREKAKRDIFTAPLVKKAIYFASQHHDGQYRKGIKVPYFTHPVLVGIGVCEYGGDRVQVAAAVLHDVLEDCPEVSYTDLVSVFGEEVADMVKAVSIHEVKDGLPWREKKEQYINKIKDASPRPLVIAAADKISNMQGYLEGLKREDINVNELFSGTPSDYCWYYQEILSVLESRIADNSITGRYRDIFEELSSEIAKTE